MEQCVCEREREREKREKREIERERKRKIERERQRFILFLFFSCGLPTSVGYRIWVEMFKMVRVKLNSFCDLNIV